MKKSTGNKKARDMPDKRSPRRIFRIFSPFSGYWKRRMQQRRLDQQLLRGAQQGNPKLVEDALDRGADINARDIMGRTALYLAKSSGNEEVQMMLRSRMHLIPPLTKKEVDSILKENGLM